MSKREKKPIDAGPGWLATYGDLVTLLLAFFVMMFAVSNVEQQKFDAFLRGLGDFDNAAAQPGIWPANAQQGVLAVNPNVLSVPSTGDGMTTEEAIEAIEEEITEAAGGLGLIDNVRFEADPRGLKAIITTDAVLFASGSAALTPKGFELLEGVADALVRFSFPITVEGHADNTPLQRGDYDNWNLSSDRAVAVLHQFVRHGIKPDRLLASGYGEHRPIDPADTPEARAKNRRVELIVHIRNEETTQTTLEQATRPPAVAVAGDVTGARAVTVAPPQVDVTAPAAASPTDLTDSP